MIPNGLNPFGLEERTLTFHVLENDIEIQTFQKKDRLYRYAEFPDECQSYSPQWTAPEDN